MEVYTSGLSKVLSSNLTLTCVTMQGYAFTAKMFMLQNIPKNQIKLHPYMNGPLYTLFFTFFQNTPSGPLLTSLKRVPKQIWHNHT